MKKNLLFVLCSIALIVSGLVLSWKDKPDTALAGATEEKRAPLTVIDYKQASTDFDTLTYGENAAIATSTKMFGLASTDVASTTIRFDIDGAESYDLNLCAAASSSAGVLYWRNFFSMDSGTSIITWYQETSATADSATAISHALPVHSFTFATTTEDGITGMESNRFTCFNLLTSPVGAKRVLIKLGMKGSNAILHPMVAPKRGY